MTGSPVVGVGGGVAGTATAGGAGGDSPSSIEALLRDMEGDGIFRTAPGWQLTATMDGLGDLVGALGYALPAWMTEMAPSDDPVTLCYVTVVSKSGSPSPEIISFKIAFSIAFGSLNPPSGAALPIGGVLGFSIAAPET